MIFGENQMVVGITHGKNKGEKSLGAVGGDALQDISRQNSSRAEIIVMKFIEGPKKG